MEKVVILTTFLYLFYSQVRRAVCCVLISRLNSFNNNKIIGTFLSSHKPYLCFKMITRLNETAGVSEGQNKLALGCWKPLSHLWLTMENSHSSQRPREHTHANTLIQSVIFSSHHSLYTTCPYMHHGNPFNQWLSPISYWILSSSLTAVVSNNEVWAEAWSQAAVSWHLSAQPPSSCPFLSSTQCIHTKEEGREEEEGRKQGGVREERKGEEPVRGRTEQERKSMSCI